MSETQNINGNHGIKNPLPSAQDDWSDDELSTYEDNIDNAEENGDPQESTFQKTHVTLDQIKDLERKVSSQKNLQGKDQDLLGILGEAENDELSAEREEKFAGDTHQQNKNNEHLQSAIPSGYEG